MTTKILYSIIFLTGIGLVFIGIRFLVLPEAGEAGYGIQFQESGDYSFHYIKGIRDVFSGLIVCYLLLAKQIRALAFVLLFATIIPIADLYIVIQQPYNGFNQIIPHLSAILVCLVGGLALLRRLDKKPVSQLISESTQVIQSAAAGGDSILYFSVSPGESTPTHFHTKFTESFSILQGDLELAIDGKKFTAKAGDKVTISPFQKHNFHNRSTQSCRIKVQVSPGNIDFERALMIVSGLAKEGQTSKSGTPKRLEDLALFIQLNNSRMTGLQKIAEPFFRWIANRATRRGRLRYLIDKFC